MNRLRLLNSDHPAMSCASSRATDVSALAVLMVAVGVVALMGSWVLPAAALSVLQVRFVALAGLLIVAGMGLWCRMNWARCGVIGVFAAVIGAQLQGRWLQSDVPALLIDSLRGVHDTGVLPVVSLNELLPPASASAAGLGLALCVVLGGFIARLLSASVRAEFVPTRPGPAKAVKPKPVKVRT
jgi:hypothetical protein